LLWRFRFERLVKIVQIIRCWVLIAAWNGACLNNYNPNLGWIVPKLGLEKYQWYLAITSDRVTARISPRR
jgi:hypothetical protein